MFFSGLVTPVLIPSTWELPRPFVGWGAIVAAPPTHDPLFKVDCILGFGVVSRSKTTFRF